ncbi:helix-turn-helix domain-containing protein [Micromonospora sp. NBC_01813]|uniref:helix-turn-helix domain-containing protein n=1 Tax=Micromonospora sp. NBC_01813 TaxID=2975988 RepID=UPI002DDB5F2F|nr:helix-turn-helix transcriptional regulator [Micromonospora sp. NBC_01813]
MPHKPFIRTLRAQWLGQQLRQIREQRGMTLKLVATHLNRDMSALGRYERADWPIRREDVVALLDLYGFHRADERAHLLSLAEEVWRTDRWNDAYDNVIDSSFIDFPWLESRADRICSYHSTVMPGLFQLRDYAELVIREVEGPKAPEGLIQRGIALRMDRQQMLERGQTKINAIIDESALRRPIGTPKLMQDQLRRILQLARQPQIEVRVLPRDIGLHPALDGSFWVFEMPTPYPAVGYLESLAGQMYFESPKADRFVSAYHRTCDAALDPRESAGLISKIVEELA